MRKAKPILKESYLKAIKNSVGAKTWCSFFAQVDGKKKDILKNGDLSCAFFVSSILVMFGLMKRIHMTVKSTVKDMEENGWYEIKNLKPGSVILWEEKEQKKGSRHFHLGFYVGNNRAVSNRWEHKEPIIHHHTYGKKGDKSPVRKIEKIFWHEKLDE